MSIEEESPLRKFPDRSLRQSLEHPANLRALLNAVIPDVAAELDVEQRIVCESLFPLEDWREREIDLLFEIPYRTGEERVLVCVLIEHQSTTDPLMPFRMLFGAVQYWDRQWKTHREQGGTAADFRLRTVIPIVFYTANRPWGSTRTLSELALQPELFTRFCPNWEPVFWNLSDSSIEDLLNNEEAWMQMLAIVRAEGEESEIFREVFRRIFQQFQSLYTDDKIRWGDLLRLVYTWGIWRGEEDERGSLQELAVQSQEQLHLQQEIKQMGKTMAERWWEQGEEKGRKEGREEGALIQARKTLFKLGQQHLGEPAESIQTRIKTMDDLNQLEILLDKAFQVESWEELLNSQE